MYQQLIKKEKSLGFKEFYFDQFLGKTYLNKGSYLSHLVLINSKPRDYSSYKNIVKLFKKSA